MSQALENFELASLHFAPEILLFGGIAVVLLGLCMWVGGLRWSAWIAAVIAALGGLVCALLFTNRTVEMIVLLTVIPAGLATFLKRPLIIMSGAALVAFIGVMIGAGPVLSNSQLSPPSHPMPYDGGLRATLSVRETAVELNSELLFWADSIVQAIGESSKMWFGAGAVAAVVVLGAGYVFPRLVAALTCSSLGTCLIYGGMVIVLLYKGAQPLSHIYSRGPFYFVVALAMIAFGTLAQLALCPSRRKTAESRENSGER